MIPFLAGFGTASLIFVGGFAYMIYRMLKAVR